jgi:glycerophosphoryl diester phosphodiesterase
MTTPSQRIIGHRGARDIWPENSRQGFRNVLALGVHGVEFDVHPSADGTLFVIHDATLDRTTEGTGPVSARSSAELAATRLRGTEEGIPTLDEVLDILGPSGLELHVELKADAAGQPYPGLERLVAEQLRRRGLAARSVLTSFWLPVLKELRAAWGDGRLLASIDAKSVDRQGGLAAVLDGLDALRIDLVAVKQDLLAQQMDLFLRRVGTPRLGAWVVNTPEDIARWRAAPVGLITTDRPDLFGLNPAR